MVSSVNRAWSLLKTLPRLGYGNVGRVLLYRLQKASGLLRFTSSGPAPAGTMFPSPSPRADGCEFRQELFGRFCNSWTSPPDWHVNPIDPRQTIDRNLTWSDALDRVPAGTDVKCWWELSRFCWVPELAQHAHVGRMSALATLNEWLQDWLVSNPPYRGINWACGQEASIRVLNLALASKLLGQVDSASPLLAWTLAVHLRRIAPTLHYAIGQANNHGVSEAVALFVGGSWLSRLGDDAEARQWAEQGRRWLLDRAQELVMEDGTCSQYSVTYHRAYLELFCMAEVWRRELDLAEFDAAFYERLRRAGRWLFVMTHPETGDAPNLGPNDGSHLFSIARGPYRDFRPTVALAAALFDDAVAYPDCDAFEDRSGWLGLRPPSKAWTSPASMSFPDGGYHVLRRGEGAVFFRYPAFRFRPGHADSLHVDLWLGAEAIVRDGGSYSYADSLLKLETVAGHNTLQFDDRDQMPKIGRFLYGEWPQAQDPGCVREEHDCVQVSSSYADYLDAYHRRTLRLGDDELLVSDEFRGFSSKAVLRWRLCPGTWSFQCDNQKCELTSLLGARTIRLIVRGSMPLVRSEVVRGWESQHYLEKAPLQVLEIEVREAGTLTTVISWKE